MRALLFSGGIDSTAVAVWLRPDVLITVDYGQVVAGAEVRAAVEIARLLGLRHEVVEVDCAKLGTGQLAGRPASELAAAAEWWPYRNQLLVTVAGMRLVGEGLSEIMLGTVAGDEIHHDGRPEFVQAISRLMNLQEGAVRVSAPALALTSEDLLARTPQVSELLPWTFSCHVAEYACGQCRGCAKHQAVLASVT